MSAKFETGQVLTGKVAGIQSYGAFVALDDETQGLVHISEITHGYVNDVNDYLSVGEEVQVKVLKVDEANNKVSLSIRATQDAPQKQDKHKPKQKEQDVNASGFNTLKDKLEDWIEQSSTFNK